MRPLAIALGLVLFASGHQFAPAQATKALLLFGGADHKTFLGCLNCSNISPDSVCNNIGEHGSNIASESIWNNIGDFGSNVSSSSPWNNIGTDPPVIVDRDGTSYGYFTINNIKSDRTRIAALVRVLDFYAKTKELDKTRDFMCN